MQTISRYPIFPSSAGCSVLIPEGSQLLSVSLNIHTYYMHVLHDAVAGGMNQRCIVALQDDATYQNAPLGQYLGRCDQAGDARGWHFFEMGVVQHDTCIGDGHMTGGVFKKIGGAQ